MSVMDMTINNSLSMLKKKDMKKMKVAIQK